jgi:hypothetical protein
VAWPAVAVIAAGAGMYLWCLWVFATVGRGAGTLGHAAACGGGRAYPWVRNPINIARSSS